MELCKGRNTQLRTWMTICCLSVKYLTSVPVLSLTGGVGVEVDNVLSVTRSLVLRLELGGSGLEVQKRSVRSYVDGDIKPRWI